MTILALDTSSKAASCALLRDGLLVGEYFLNASLTHSQTAMPMVRAMLDGAGVRMEEIELFAVSTGPGSFTGLRIGIAAVKGMAAALGRPCAGVSTLESLAANLVSFDGLVVPVMDARRSQVYTARFRCGGAVERLCGDGAVPVERLRGELAAVDGPVMLVGDGAAMCKAAMEDLPQVRLAPEDRRHQRAGSVAALAAALPPDKLCAAGELAPTYLRLPQAERERLARLDNRRREDGAP